MRIDEGVFLLLEPKKVVLGNLLLKMIIISLHVLTTYESMKLQLN